MEGEEGHTGRGEGEANPQDGQQYGPVVGYKKVGEK